MVPFSSAAVGNFHSALDTSVSGGSLAVGVILAVGAIALAGLPSLSRALRLRTSARTIDTIGRDPNPTDEPHEDFPGDANDHPVARSWWKLPPTQKEIVIFLYEHSHKARIRLDEFYSAILAKHGKQFVSSEDELFYRLKTLKAEGFLDLAAIGQKESDVMKLEFVRKILAAADIINT